MEWTKAQKDAIQARDGTLLVSAAAGSGKTAVLVQRVIERLTDEKNPCDADSLLIVTFTRAATAQMREKVSAALSQRLAADPTNKRLAHQQMLLPFAKICTIDSFCSDLVKENFPILGISPDFTVLDQSQEDIIHADAVSAVIEKLYAEKSEAFIDLVELLHNGSDDSRLENTVLQIWERAYAYPFPEDYLSSLLSDYDTNKPISETLWAKTILDYVESIIDYSIDTTERTIKITDDDDEVARAYRGALESDLVMLGAVKKAVQDGGWDKIRSAISNMADSGFVKLGSIKRGYESPIKDAVKLRRDKIKKYFKEKLTSFMCESEDEYLQSITVLSPIVKKLLETVRLFIEELDEYKAAANAYEFSDISHFAIKLLLERDTESPGHKYKRTALAQELSQSFSEILVDEYQDINKLQDMLFEAISRDGKNLFMVGDVKQSIYRFRQAMPEIFLDRRSKLSEYVSGNYPARLSLDRNFRSRSGVTDTVNFIFSQLMYNGSSEIDYKGEELVAAATYPDSCDADAEIHLLTVGDKKSKEAEAEYIAELIEKTVSSSMKISDGGVQRSISYGDICILARSNSGRFSLFAEALSRRNIPSVTSLASNFFESKEINFMLSLLRVTDNPMRDVPLLSVLLSPVFGFTPDDLAKIRLYDKSVSLYACIKICADEIGAGDGEDSENEIGTHSSNRLPSDGRLGEKCADFLRTLALYRRLSSTFTVGELISRLIEETSIRAISAAMPHGMKRRANLDILLSCAENYEKTGRGGLPGFIRFIDRLSENKSKFELPEYNESNSNAVKIMTIHKSKGLEFPVCILAGCSGKFNNDDIKPNVLVSSKSGIGLFLLDSHEKVKYHTVCRTAAKLSIDAAMKNEELRVLYVAMTRAKEKLIMIASEKDARKALVRLAPEAAKGLRISPVAVRSAFKYSDWLLTAALKHPDASDFRREAGLDESICLDAAFKLKTVIAVAADSDAAQGEQVTPEFKSQPDEELLKLIDERLSYVYPYQALTGVVAKHTASALSHSGINSEFFASSAPSFMSEGALTAAQRGTAMHSFMQYSDHSCACENLEGEIERLTRSGFLTQQQAASLNREKLKKYFTGSLSARINASQTVFKEKKFTIEVPAIELYKDLPKSLSDETVLIQGVVDCAFIEEGEAVIVDYKTDRAASPEELLERYSTQLAIYKRAFEECIGFKVRQTLLYSFELGEIVAEG